MNQITKISLLIFLSILCISCSFSLVEPIDSTKLNYKNTKRGLVIFRAIYFDDGSDLTEDNSVFVQARGFREVYEINRWSYNRPVINGKKIDKKLFIVGSTTDSSKEDIFKPEYFYDISILPEGEYELWSVSFKNKYERKSYFSASKSYFSMSNPQDYHFHIKAGVINYIGDLYISSPTITKKGWVSPSNEKYVEQMLFPFHWAMSKNEYAAQYLVLDRYQDAQNFVKKFHPEIDLPFTKNIITNNRSNQKVNTHK